MSKFISLNILAAIGLGRSKRTAGRETPGAPPVAEKQSEDSPGTREEPSSASRLRVNRVRVEG